jgi:predicted nucleotidyltransferase
VAAELTFEELLALAHEQDDILGLYLFGSRGRNVMVDERSDWDVCVVLRDDDALARFDATYPYAHGARVEIASTTLAELRESGAIGSSSEYTSTCWSTRRMARSLRS